MGLPMGSGQIASYQFEHIQHEYLHTDRRFISSIIHRFSEATEKTSFSFLYCMGETVYLTLNILLK